MHKAVLILLVLLFLLTIIGNVYGQTKTAKVTYFSLVSQSLNTIDYTLEQFGLEDSINETFYLNMNHLKEEAKSLTIFYSNKTFKIDFEMVDKTVAPYPTVKATLSVDGMMVDSQQLKLEIPTDTIFNFPNRKKSPKINIRAHRAQVPPIDVTITKIAFVFSIDQIASDISQAETKQKENIANALAGIRIPSISFTATQKENEIILEWNLKWKLNTNPRISIFKGEADTKPDDMTKNSKYLLKFLYIDLDSLGIFIDSETTNGVYPYQLLYEDDSGNRIKSEVKYVTFVLQKREEPLDEKIPSTVNGGEKPAEKSEVPKISDKEVTIGESIKVQITKVMVGEKELSSGEKIDLKTFGDKKLTINYGAKAQFYNSEFLINEAKVDTVVFITPVSEDSHELKTLNELVSADSSKELNLVVRAQDAINTWSASEPFIIKIKAEKEPPTIPPETEVPAKSEKKEAIPIGEENKVTITTVILENQNVQLTSGEEYSLGNYTNEKYEAEKIGVSFETGFIFDRIEFIVNESELDEDEMKEVEYILLVKTSDMKEGFIELNLPDFRMANRLAINEAEEKYTIQIKAFDSTNNEFISGQFVIAFEGSPQAEPSVVPVELPSGTILEALAKIDKRFVEGVFRTEAELERCIGAGTSRIPAGLEGETSAVMPALAFEEAGEEETFCFTSFVIRADQMVGDEWGVVVSWNFKGTDDVRIDLFLCANSGKIDEEKTISFKDKSRIARDKEEKKIEIDGVACKFSTYNYRSVAVEIPNTNLAIGENAKFMAVAYDKDDKWLAETGWHNKDEGIYPDEK